MDRASLVKKMAREAGFDYCSISKAVFLEEEAPRLESWLKKNYHAEMHWMENHFDKRLDPRLLVPGAKSVISLSLNYFPENPNVETQSGLKISKYAWGKDYHSVIKSQLKSLFSALNQHFGNIEGRIFVDSAPVMDKAWAAKSGMGWIGKHSNLIQKKTGSFFFLAEIISDLELEPDPTATDHCGTCTRCIDACPTDAIVQPYVVDANRCISYLTIELKEQIPEVFRSKMENWMFGCDICQDVCPWNRFSKPNTTSALQPIREIFSMSISDWEALTDDTFKEIFGHSALKRAKLKGLRRNIEFSSHNPSN